MLDMSQEAFAGLLVFLGAIVAAVLFVADRQGRRLAESIPPELMPVLLGLLALAKELAAATPTAEDDALIARIEAALKGNAPVLPPAAPQTPEELAARLNLQPNSASTATTANTLPLVYVAGSPAPTDNAVDELGAVG